MKRTIEDRMRMPRGLHTDVAFFWEHGGYSFREGVEWPEDARLRCAIEATKAEEWGRAVGLSFCWELDGMDSSEWSDDPDPWATWVCVARRGTDEIVASLGGVDFGRDGTPWGNTYRRVVEAMLAQEVKEGGK